MKGIVEYDKKTGKLVEAAEISRPWFPPAPDPKIAELVRQSRERWKVKRQAESDAMEAEFWEKRHNEPT